MSSTPTKNIIITGAGGFIGPLLASRLLDDPSYRVVLTDVAEPAVPAGVAHPENAVALRGDICDAAFVARLLGAARPLFALFLFHGVMSAGSEADWDLSLRVNVDSVRGLLLAVRAAYPGGGGVRVVYASAQAVYGRPLPAGGRVADAVAPTPEGTYGAHKLLTEVLLNDMHRRGFFDVFSLRLPTVAVRPGRPTAAASSFLSGMIREPMRGAECAIPLRDRGFRAFVCSPAVLQENLVRVLALDPGCLPPHVRHVNMPGISVSVQQLVDALARHGGADRLRYLREEPDPALERILRSWAPEVDTATARRLGLLQDESADALVKQYVDSLKSA
ncbi:NAD(P)-binding protein [Durotheca rogersii]|uniref:NAD(P)-binding protein n=1 Tax=Durotheca rogersii TaxID=419775 RepID=UPI00221EF2B1|nr:NAD(P)-binding protein [Durotheca rogersii]KAI5868405.1 NAD(P)-binding protein [Durotheca rogersii]